MQIVIINIGQIFSALFYVPTFLREGIETEFFHLPSEINFFQGTNDDSIEGLLWSFMLHFSLVACPDKHVYSAMLNLLIWIGFYCM